MKQEYHDIDYTDKLSEKEKAWMANFMEEDLGARFNHEGKKIYKNKRDRKASYNRNNARNRDQYGIAKATGKAVDIPADQAYQYWEENYVDVDYENKLVEGIDKDQAMPILSLDEVIKLKDNLSDNAKAFYAQHYSLTNELLQNPELMESEKQATDSDEC